MKTIKFKKRKFARKNNILTPLMLVVFCFLTCGYAAISSRQDLGGVSTFKSSTWEIYFDNVQVDSKSNVETAAPVISAAKDTVEFNVALTKAHDIYKFTVDLVNNGSVDAMIADFVKTPELTEKQKTYIDYVVNYDSGAEIKLNDKLPAHSTVKVNVLIRFKNSATPQDIEPITYRLHGQISFKYAQADANAQEVAFCPLTTVSNTGLQAYSEYSVDHTVCGNTRMYAFEHPVTEQLNYTKDYRFIGGAYCSYDGGKYTGTLVDGKCPRITKVIANEVEYYGSPSSHPDRKYYAYGNYTESTLPAVGSTITLWGGIVYKIIEATMVDSDGMIGTDPKNYMTFNGETAGWRIIGVFPTEDYEGNIEYRIKLIRDKAIGKFKFDNKYGDYSGKIPLGTSYSEFSTNFADAQVMYMMNLNNNDPDVNKYLLPGYSYDKTTGYVKDVNGNVMYKAGCAPARIDVGDTTYTCEAVSWKLNDEALNYTTPVKWYDGAILDSDRYYDEETDPADLFVVELMYKYERGTNVYTSLHFPTAKQNYSAFARVGLMNASDYGFTFANGVMPLCYQSPTHCTNDKNDPYTSYSAGPGYPEYSWLFHSQEPNWFIGKSYLPEEGSGVDNMGYITGQGGTAVIDMVVDSEPHAVRPVVYLNADVQLVGEGTHDNPYRIRTSSEEY